MYVYDLVMWEDTHRTLPICVQHAWTRSQGWIPSSETETVGHCPRCTGTSQQRHLYELLGRFCVCPPPKKRKNHCSTASGASAAKVSGEAGVILSGSEVRGQGRCEDIQARGAAGRR